MRDDLAVRADGNRKGDSSGPSYGSVTVHTGALGILSQGLACEPLTIDAFSNAIMGYYQGKQASRACITDVRRILAMLREVGIRMAAELEDDGIIDRFSRANPYKGSRRRTIERFSTP